MGFGDFMRGLGNAYLNYTPTGKVINAFVSPAAHPAGPAGSLTGPPPDPSRLVKHADGSAVDPVTGQTYFFQPPKYSANGNVDPGGYTAVATPNVAQQSTMALNRAGGFYDAAGGYDQREAQAYGQEQGVADMLNRMAMGAGPTVAGAQLAAGNDQAVRSQLAAAGGASGNNAALARLAATGNMAQVQANTNQQQALARTAEQTNAIGQLRAVTGDMTQQSGQMAGQKLNVGQDLSRLAMSGEGGHEQMQFDANKAAADASNADKARWMNMGTSLLNASVA